MARASKAMLVAILTVLLGVYGLAPGVSAEERESRQDIFISEDGHFNPANGVRSGTGTPEDPYVISGWQVRNIHLKDTSAAVLIRDNVVTGRLTLNWNGGNITVVDNQIRDLRVNENVRRTGEPTSGLIARNKFDVVGQLRHFDGVFENNVVTGNRQGLQIPFFQNGQSVNFDGFNGSRFRNNTINGFVTVRLHGHHHSSGFGEDSHYHGAAPAEHHHHGAMADHSQRYHRVYITNNVITSPGPYALNYVDTAHSANDRTAASETNEELNKPHVHYTRVYMNNNRLIGSGLYVNIFNADDQRHTGTRTGLLEIKNNTINFVQEDESNPFRWEEPAGISIYRATDVHMLISGNKITRKDERGSVSSTEVPFFQGESVSGVMLHYIEKAQIHIADNFVSAMDFGVSARQMTESVEWWIHGLQTESVAQDVYWDNSVENPPHRD
ncbi:MAG: hypothetical protein M3161_04315 [Actinomycetota bacterium]|nr:hypothetical protein [Actinomycetota bacterium]